MLIQLLRKEHFITEMNLVLLQREKISTRTLD